jgi:magnesium transporter
VLHAIADHVVDHYLDVTTRIESDIDEMETQVFAPRSQVSAEQIYFMKREVLELRRAVMPLKTPLQRLAEGYTPLVPDEVRSYFRDVDDHLATVSERVVNFDELPPPSSTRRRPRSRSSRTPTCARSPRGPRSSPSAPRWPASTG